MNKKKTWEKEANKQAKESKDTSGEKVRSKIWNGGGKEKTGNRH